MQSEEIIYVFEITEDMLLRIIKISPEFEGDMYREGGIILEVLNVVTEDSDRVYEQVVEIPLTMEKASAISNILNYLAMECVNDLRQHANVLSMAIEAINKASESVDDEKRMYG